MKLYYVPFLVLPFALTACANLGNGDGSGGYGEMTEESLSTAVATEAEDSYLMAAAPEYHVGTPFKVGDVQYSPVEDLAYNQTGVAGIVPSDLNGRKTKKWGSVQFRPVGCGQQGSAFAINRSGYKFGKRKFGHIACERARPICKFQIG